MAPRLRLPALALLLLGAAAAAAVARGAATPASAADRVLALHAEGAAVALRKLALRDDPDPWRVAEVLARREAWDAATAYAKAAPRPDVSGLPAQLAAWRSAGAAERRAWWKALAAADAALASGAHDAAMAEAEALSSSAGSYLRARALRVRHRALRQQGRAAAALPLAVRCAEESRAAGWLRGAAEARFTAGNLALETGDVKRALEQWRSELSVNDERALPVQAARTRVNVGSLHAYAGDYVRAIDVLRRAEATLREHGHMTTAARALETVGISQLYLGRYAAALASHEQALRIFRRDLQGASGARERRAAKESIATNLDLLGSVHERLGDYRRAREKHEEALGLIAMAASPMRANIIGNLGTAQLRLGNYDAAADRYLRAREMYERLEDARQIARADSNLGRAYTLKGDLARAEQRLLAAREGFTKLEDWYGLAVVHSNLGDLHARDEERRTEAVMALETAIQHAQTWGLAAVELVARVRLARVLRAAGRYEDVLAQASAGTKVMRRVVVGLGTRHGSLARSTMASLFEHGALAARRLGDHARVFAHLESGRAGALLSSLEAQQVVRDRVLPAALRDAERAARDRAAAAGIRLLQAGRQGSLPESRARRRELEDAQRKLDEIIGRIERRQMAVANLLYPTADSLKAVQARLGKADAIVLYGVFAEETVAAIVTRGGVRSVSLAAPAELLPVLDRIEPDAAGAYDARTRKELRKLLIQPLALGEAQKRVFVSPSGPLHQVPFGLLLGDRKTIHIPSATTHGVLATRARQRGEQVLALGGVDYSAYRRLGDLPSSAAEARAVGDVHLIGGQATERGLVEALGRRSRWRAVHLACHGVFRRSGGFDSYLALTPGEDAAQGDGRLTALELLRTPMPADLVVLAACDSARGTVVEGEGLLGLVRAVFVGGSAGVIANLWKADDRAATEFSKAFHAERKKPGVTAATALQRAQRHVQTLHEDWRDPYYWAGWVLWGADH